MRAFVTSLDTFNGNFSGIDGADASCQSLASAATLSGTWIAWLSDSTVDARDRVLDVEYRLVDDTTVVATDLTDLTNGGIANPINLTEAALAVTGANTVWTGTDELGLVLEPNTCNGWTSNSSGDVGLHGVDVFSSSSWTNSDAIPCDSLAHLYCFERPLRAFVTSTTPGTNLGGIPGADAICQDLADNAPFGGIGGTWVALLSTSLTNAADRIPDTEYRLVDNTTVIATSKADLFDGMLDAPINLDETGTPQSGTVTTGTETTGVMDMSGNFCNDWMSASGMYIAGDASLSATGWIENNISADCGTATNNRLYCFEIAPRPCGAEGEPCCASDACGPGLVCSVGICGAPP